MPHRRKSAFGKRKALAGKKKALTRRKIRGAKPKPLGRPSRRL